MQKIRFILLWIVVNAYTFVLYGQDSVANIENQKFRFRDIFVLQEKLDSKVRFLFKLDDRITVVRTDAVDVTGLQIGLQKRRCKYWLGYAFINAPTKTRIFTERKQNTGIPPDANAKIDTIKINLDLKFLTVAPEYVFVWRKYYEISAAIGVGCGVYEIERKISSATSTSTNRSIFIPIEPALKLAIKPTRWAGFSASIGYRETLSLANSNFNYSGLFYSYGISVYIGNLFEDFQRIILGRKPIITL
jgi:hypothetical protein